MLKNFGRAKKGVKNVVAAKAKLDEARAKGEGLGLTKETIKEIGTTVRSINRENAGQMAKSAGKTAAKTGFLHVVRLYFPPINIAFWFGEGKDYKAKDDPTAPKSKVVTGFWAGIIRLLLRLLQEVMAIVVIAMYTPDLIKAKADGKPQDPRWMYAIFLALISFLYALFISFPFWRYWRYWIAVDTSLFVCWLVCFGIFGKLYLPADPEENGRMRSAAYIDAVCMVLWFLSAAHGGLGFWLWRREDLKRNPVIKDEEKSLPKNGAEPGRTESPVPEGSNPHYAAQGHDAYQIGGHPGAPGQAYQSGGQPHFRNAVY